MEDALRGRSLLAIFAHPDDESLACGGVLALCADAGMRVSLVCATRGEDGPDSSAPAGSPLADRRARELASAADVLGIEHVTLLDFEDGMLPWTDGDDLHDAIEAAIQRWLPDAIITFDEDGLYWHPDHIAVHRATTDVVTAMDAGAPALYYATLPPGAMRRLVDAVKDRLELGKTAVLGVEDADAFGSMSPEPELILDVSSTAPRKLAALRCHESQTRGGPFEVLTDAESVTYLGVEHLRRAPVGNTGDAILELLPRRTE